MKCLLIELKDKRKFFTDEKNFDQLIEFCNSFKANLSTVKLKNGELLDLDELAPVLCNQKQKKQDYDYVVIENKIISKPSKKLKQTVPNKIKNSIRRAFLSKKVVNIKQLEGKYSKYGINSSNLCSYMKEIKAELSARGFSFAKVDKDSYRIA